MLGYIVPDKPELKIREYEKYRGYYCGVCKSIGRRFGQAPRMVLSYDAAFLALVLSSLEEEKEICRQERCIVHPLKKRRVVSGQKGVDYAADMMLLLAYFKALDDRRDEGTLKSGAALAFLKNTYKKLMKTHEEKGIIVESKLRELAALEKEPCASLDRAAEPFAQLMRAVFTPGYLGPGESKAGTLEALSEMGYHLGKWIYLIDAFDDLEENAKDGGYNPLLLQYGYQKGGEELDAFRDRIKERAEYNLHCYLTGLAHGYRSLQPNKNKGLLENIIYFGLLNKTEQVLKKGNIEDGKSV